MYSIWIVIRQKVFTEAVKRDKMGNDEFRSNWENAREWLFTKTSLILKKIESYF
jgi:hypothetical protein